MRTVLTLKHIYQISLFMEKIGYKCDSYFFDDLNAYALLKGTAPNGDGLINNGIHIPVNDTLNLLTKAPKSRIFISHRLNSIYRRLMAITGLGIEFIYYKEKHVETFKVKDRIIRAATTFEKTKDMYIQTSNDTRVIILRLIRDFLKVPYLDHDTLEELLKLKEFIVTYNKALSARPKTSANSPQIYPAFIQGIPIINQKIVLNGTINDDPVKRKVRGASIFVDRDLSMFDFEKFIKSDIIIVSNGSLTCHAATLCREIGKFCIVGAKNAHKILSLLDYVEVDMGTGRINIIQHQTQRIPKIS